MKTLMDYSQFGQPRAFRSFLPADTPRYVLDVGAHDGITGSNSREFILEGWQELLVEPLPSAFAALSANSRGLANVECVNLACSAQPGVGRLYVGIGGDDTQTSTLSLDAQLAPQRSDSYVDVKLATVTQLLEQYGWPERFGLLLVDAEGFDLEVLQGLDITRFRPDVIVTEEYENNPDKQSRKFQLLRSYGYRYCGVFGSDSFWRNAALPAGETLADSLFYGSSLPSEFANLRHQGPGLFYYDDPPLSATETAVTLPASGTVCVSGWAFNPATKACPPHVFLCLLEPESGTVEMIQGYRLPRPDVAKHFGSENLVNSGFRFKLPACGVRSGRRLVSVIQVGDQGMLDSRGSAQFSFAPAPEDTAARFLGGTGLQLGQHRFTSSARAIVKDIQQICPFPEGGDCTEALRHVAAGSQDFVVCSYYLENCPDAARALSACLGVLKENGILLILSQTVPPGRFGSLENFLRFLLEAGDSNPAFHLAAFATHQEGATAVVQRGAGAA